MRGLLVLVSLALAGCSVETPTPTPTPTAIKSTTSDRLPGALIGRWGVTTANCAPASELGITVEPIRIRFYESIAEITRVTSLPDGTLSVNAEVTAEGEREVRSFDLKLLDGGARLSRVEAPFPDITYIRCKAQR